MRLLPRHRGLLPLLAAFVVHGAVVGSVSAQQPAAGTAPARAVVRAVVLLHANVIDGVSDAPIRDATIVLRDGRISSIGAAPASLPAGAETIDVQGRWVLPGLMDAHTHIADLAAMKRALTSGVTTVRSASVSHFEDVGLRELVRTGALAGPEVLAAGTFVTPDLGESITGDPRLARLAGGVQSTDDLRYLVRVNLDRGVDVIKTRTTERAGTPTTDPRMQVYTERQLRAVVEEAATRGVGVLTHAHGDEGAWSAVSAGVRSIEHGTFISDSTIALMVKRGTYLVPTYTTLRDLVEPGGDYDDPVTHNRGLFMLPIAREMVRRAHKAGVKIATGVDTQYGERSTSRVSQEMVAFVDEMGFTPMEAIRAATTVAAELFGIARRTGSLRPGMEADLIVVTGNPLEDIHTVQDAIVVVSNGQVALNRLPFGRRN
jgi:imidazolonepropionase-like amidohydrolase